MVLKSDSQKSKGKEPEKTERVTMIMLIDQTGFFGEKFKGQEITCDAEQAKILKQRGIADYKNEV